MCAQAPPLANRRWDVEELALRIESAGVAGRYAVRVLKTVHGGPLGAAGGFACSSAEAERLVAAVESAVAASRARLRAAAQLARDLVPDTAGSPAFAVFGCGAAAGEIPSDAGAAADAAGGLTPEAVGDRLFEWLLSGNLREMFLQCLAGVERGTDRRLRIRIQLDPSLPDFPELAALPWEALRRPDTADLLARRPPTLVVRHVDAPRLQVQEPSLTGLRILAIRAQPHGSRPLALEQELRRLQAAWKQRPGVEIELLDPPTRQSLQRALNARSFNVLHFMGHGDFAPDGGEGRLLFEDDAGQPDPIAGSLLAEMLCGNRALRLVVLNACATARVPRQRGRDPFSSAAGALVQAGVPAVVAMQFAISDDAALIFSEALYTALADDAPIDVAVAEARMAVHVKFPPSWEWVTPALFMSVPDGRLLAPAGAGGDAAIERTSRWRRLALLVVAVALIVALAIGWMLWRLPAPEPPGPPRIEAGEAARHAGEEVVVCGFVADVVYAADATGQPTFLDFEKAFPEEPFRAVIWSEVRSKLARPPETQYVRRRLCVSGRVELYRGRPEIIVRDLTQLAAAPP
jgi:hypothetical protein